MQCRMHNDFASGPDRDPDFTQLSSTKGGFVIAVKSRQLGGKKKNVRVPKFCNRTN